MEEISQIGAKDVGTIRQVVARDVVVVAVEHPRAEEGAQVDEDAVSVDMIRWLVTGAGCIAIWPVTVPKMLELLEEAEPPTLHMCNEARVATEVEDVALNSVI